jgi:recombination DNA repair RAD52 pathway protein
MFTPEQEQALAAPLNGDFVKQRPGAGNRALSYIEGWRVIEQANAILGAGNWSREVLSLESVHECKLITDPEAPEKGKVVACFMARVRVVVWSKDGTRSVVREGHGVARGFAKTVGEAVEAAVKSAETDGTKRCLAGLGSSLGLALYDPEQANVTPSTNGRRQAHAIESGFGRPTISQRARVNGKQPPSDIPV